MAVWLDLNQVLVQDMSATLNLTHTGATSQYTTVDINLDNQCKDPKAVSKSALGSFVYRGVSVGITGEIQ